MELLLIRHGRPRVEHASQPGAVADPPLTEAGRAQAALLGDWLAARPGFKLDVVYTSPMRRARETAEEIVSRISVPLRADNRLREFDWGAASYQPPELSPTAHRAALWQALETGIWGDHRFDPNEFERRVGTAFADIIDAHASAVVAVVCHGGVINSFLGTVLQRPRGMFFQPAYTSVSRVLAARGGHRQVVSLNETGHLHLAAEPDRDRAGAATDHR